MALTRYLLQNVNTTMNTIFKNKCENKQEWKQTELSEHQQLLTPQIES